MKWLILAAVMLTLVLFQTSVAPLFEVFNVGPNLLLVSLCCLAILRDPRETMIAAPLAGLGMGLLAFQGAAESVAALAPIGAAAMFWRGDPNRPAILAALLLTALATALHFVVLAVAVELTTTGVNWLEAARDVMLPGMAVNVLLAIPVYAAARTLAASREPRAAF